MLNTDGDINKFIARESNGQLSNTSFSGCILLREVVALNLDSSALDTKCAARCSHYQDWCGTGSEDSIGDTTQGPSANTRATMTGHDN